MNNENLRRIEPVWSEERDHGGMFPATLSVRQDPDGGPYPFLAVVTDGWGGGAQARRETLAAAKNHTEVLFKKLFG
jgi:hypothetical protein